MAPSAPCNPAGRVEGWEGPSCLVLPDMGMGTNLDGTRGAGCLRGIHLDGRYITARGSEEGRPVVRFYRSGGR